MWTDPLSLQGVVSQTTNNDASTMQIRRMSSNLKNIGSTTILQQFSTVLRRVLTILHQQRLYNDLAVIFDDFAAIFNDFARISAHKRIYGNI